MISGMEVYNTDGILLVSTNDPLLVVDTILYNQNLIGIQTLTIPYNGWPESPTILIRPRAGGFYGYFYIVRSGANVVIRIQTSLLGTSPQPFDIAVAASAKALNRTTSGTFGLDTFDPQGNLIFSSSFKYARVRQIARVPGPNISIPGNTTSAAITEPFSSMPWVIARDAMQSVAFSGGASSIPSAVGFFFTINSARTLISVRTDDSANNNSNQYAGRFLSFPLCVIPGT